MRSLPDNSLADDALLSPASISGHEQSTFQCHDVSNRGPNRSSTKSKKKEDKIEPAQDAKAFSLQTNSILSLLSANNFLRACTPSIPADGGEDTPKTRKKSIWSYLDPNDDLYEYDDTKSPDATDSSDDDDCDSEKLATQAYRRRRRKKTPSPKLSPKSRHGDSLRQAYEDLMFISKDKHRSSTPNTIGSRSSYTHTTSRTTPDPENADPSPTLSQIREDLWGNVPTLPKGMAPARGTHGTPILSNYSLQAQRTTTDRTTPSPSESLAAASIHAANQGDTIPLQQSLQCVQQPLQRSTVPYIHDNNTFDPFELGGSRLQYQERNMQQQQQAIHTDTTPRASNHLESDYLGHGNCVHSQKFMNQVIEGNSSRRHSFAINKRDTKPRRTRPHSFAGERQQTPIFEDPYPHEAQIPEPNTTKKGGMDNSFFPFAPDFYMFEALKKEIANGFQMEGVRTETAPHDDLVTIDVEGSVESQLSNLSESDRSSLMHEKLRQLQLMETVKQRSLRNYEMLKQMEEQQHQKTDQLPISEPQNGTIFKKNKSARGEVTEGSQGYLSNPDGPYMYVAYSRFGDNSKDVLQLCEHRTVPKANTRQGQMLVKILAATISPTDCDIRRGEWSSVRLNPYIVPGVAFLGVIQESSDPKKRPSAFSNFKAGEHVLSLTKQGGNARYTVASKDQLVKIPDHLDPCATVCLAETYLSAFQALHVGQRGNMRYRNDAFRGKSILVLGGSSSLGRALIEVAIAGGADYCYALAKERQFESIQQMGGIPLSKDPQRWLTLIGRQIDIMVTVTDSAGLYSDRLTPDHLKAIHENGHLVSIGPPGIKFRSSDVFSSLGAASPSPNKLICKSIKNSVMDRSFCYNVFDSWEADPKLGKRDLEHLIGLLEYGRLKPNVLERVPLNKVAKVHAILESKKIPGFIVCSPWMDDPQMILRQQQHHHRQQQQQHHQEQHYDV